MDVSEEDKLLANVADYGRLMKGYLTLFKKFETDENDGMPILEWFCFSVLTKTFLLRKDFSTIT